MIPDGSGGAFVVWNDSRTGESTHIFAQHLDNKGDELWGASGDTICFAPANQYDATVASDGRGGAFFAWDDARDTQDGIEDLFVQHLDSAGHPLWQQNGNNVSNNNVFVLSSSNMAPTAIPDGSGGFIVAYWNNTQAVAARIDAAGNVLWNVVTVDGLYPTSEQAIAPSGVGGCIIAVTDQNDFLATGDSADITAQRIDANGNLLWGPNGAMICNAANVQDHPAIVPDGEQGAIIAWEDFRNEAMSQIYAQRVNASGKRLWTNGTDSNGVLMTDTTHGGQAKISISPTSVHGAILTWNDDTNNVYIQKVDSAGNLLFGTTDVQLTNLTSAESSPVLTGDGADGAYVAWQDKRNVSSKYDIYAQHVFFDGTVDYPQNGVAVCKANYNQVSPFIITDPQGGAIVAWDDQRNFHSGSSFDLYAQRIEAGGSPLSVPHAAPGVPQKFSLAQNYPNPFNPSTTITFTVARSEHATLTVFDILGRQVETLFNGDAQPERNYALRFDASRYGSGVYFYRVATPTAVDVKRMVLIK
jgi:hypothetical protein